jgi:O-antigen ligase
MLLVFFLMATDDRPHVLRMLFAVLAVSGALQGVIALLAALGGPAIDLGAAQSTRQEGTFTHPNGLGYFMAIAIPAAIALGMERKARWRVIAAATAPLILVGLALSLSRGGLIAAVGAAAMFLALRRFRRFTIAGTLAILALAAFGLVGPVGRSEPLSAFEQRFAAPNPAQPRQEARTELVWARTPEMIADHPLFGVGSNNYPLAAGSYGILNAEERKPFVHAHNDALTIAAEMGLVGLAAFGWVALAAARAIIGAARRTAGAQRVEVIAAGGIFVATALEGIVDTTLGANWVCGLLLALLGGVCAMAPAEARSSVERRPAGVRRARHAW